MFSNENDVSNVHVEFSSDLRSQYTEYMTALKSKIGYIPFSTAPLLYQSEQDRISESQERCNVSQLIRYAFL